MKVEELEGETKEETLNAEAQEVEETIRLAKAKAEAKEESVEQVDPWDAFAPPIDSEFDWLQLTSGEWLKGDFKVLYDFELECDSDEMNLQSFDFDDVKQLRCRSMKTLFV